MKCSTFETIFSASGKKLKIVKIKKRNKVKDAIPLS